VDHSVTPVANRVGEKVTWLSSQWKLCANPAQFRVEINSYKVGTDNEGLKTASDGSITIAVQNEQPDAASDLNWLPAPKGNFYVILRLYQPNDAILDGSYQLPQMTKTQ
jgi:hypothetical protein